MLVFLTVRRKNMIHNQEGNFNSIQNFHHIVGAFNIFKLISFIILARGILPAVNQHQHKECGFLVPDEYYIAVDECRVDKYGYICERKGNNLNV